MATLELKLKLDHDTAEALCANLDHTSKDDVEFSVRRRASNQARTTGFHSPEWAEVILVAVVHGMVGGVVHAAIDAGVKAKAEQALLERLAEAAAKTGSISAYSISGDLSKEGMLDELDSQNPT